MTTELLVLDELDTIIKELDEITIVSEFATLEHHLELGERKGVYFVRLDGAILFVGDSERSISFFYNQIATVHEDEESGLDPGFGTLREILISRNDHIQEALERLGEGRLSKALKFIEFSPHDTVETLYSSIISIEKASGGTALGAASVILPAVMGKPLLVAMFVSGGPGPLMVAMSTVPGGARPRLRATDADRGGVPAVDTSMLTGPPTAPLP